MTVRKELVSKVSFLCLVLAMTALVAAPASSQTNPPPCEDFSSGTSGPYLPPGCRYHAPADVKNIEDPVQMAELIAKPIHQFFVCIESTGNRDDCREPGGTLGGNKEQFTSEVVLEIKGTGSLSGYNRTVVIPNVAVEVHSGPDNPGGLVQSFPTEMISLQGALVGDPDFDELRIVGGTANGFPSPGHLDAVFDRRRGAWTIDSQFDVAYSLSFRGAPGGKLEGFAGSGEGTTHMVAIGHTDADQ